MTLTGEDLALHTLAYIETHRSEWRQGVWRCKSGMCYAGHAGMTLNPARPVLGPAAIAEAVALEHRDWYALTDAQKATVIKYQDYGHFLYARSDDPPSRVLTETIHGKRVQIISVGDRAAHLLGGSVLSVDATGKVDRASRQLLFKGENRLADIRAHLAYTLGISKAELRRRTKAIAEQEGWL